MSKINKVNKVIEERSKCIEEVKRHGLDLDLFNLEDNIDEMKMASTTMDLEQIDVKELNKSIKYYQSVYDKLTYIDKLKKLALV